MRRKKTLRGDLELGRVAEELTSAGEKVLRFVPCMCVCASVLCGRGLASIIGSYEARLYAPAAAQCNWTEYWRWLCLVSYGSMMNL